MNIKYIYYRTADERNFSDPWCSIEFENARLDYNAPFFLQRLEYILQGSTIMGFAFFLRQIDFFLLSEAYEVKPTLFDMLSCSWFLEFLYRNAPNPRH